MVHDYTYRVLLVLNGSTKTCLIAHYSCTIQIKGVLIGVKVLSQLRSSHQNPFVRYVLKIIMHYWERTILKRLQGINMSYHWILIYESTCYEDVSCSFCKTLVEQYLKITVAIQKYSNVSYYVLQIDSWNRYSIFVVLQFLMSLSMRVLKVCLQF